jgi:Luciferase-like monooxygenase
MRNGMKFGIFSLPCYVPEYDGTLTHFYTRLLELLEHAEEVGFDSAWINEHHFHPVGGMMRAPAVALTAARRQSGATIDHVKARRSLDLFASEVIPRLKREPIPALA